jgi:hypothetical protein
MADSLDETTAVSSNHTCALVGPNLYQRHLSQLGRAENLVCNGIDWSKQPGNKSGTESARTMGARKRKGSKVSERCNQLSVGELDGIVSRLLGKSQTLLIRY